MSTYWLIASVIELVLSIVALFRGDIELSRHCVTLCFIFHILSNQYKDDTEK